MEKPIFRVLVETKSSCLSSKGARYLILDLYLDITPATHKSNFISLFRELQNKPNNEYSLSYCSKNYKQHHSLPLTPSKGHK